MAQSSIVIWNLTACLSRQNQDIRKQADPSREAPFHSDSSLQSSLHGESAGLLKSHQTHYSLYINLRNICLIVNKHWGYLIAVQYGYIPVWYHQRIPFGLHCLWSAYPPWMPYIRFLSVRLRFRYLSSSRLYFAVQTLGVALGFVGNYAPVGFHHRLAACPSYQKAPSKEEGQSRTDYRELHEPSRSWWTKTAAAGSAAMCIRWLIFVRDNSIHSAGAYKVLPGNQAGGLRWTVLPVTNFDACFGTTSFSRKWLARLPGMFLSVKTASVCSDIRCSCIEIIIRCIKCDSISNYRW